MGGSVGSVVAGTWSTEAPAVARADHAGNLSGAMVADEEVPAAGLSSARTLGYSAASQLEAVAIGLRAEITTFGYDNRGNRETLTAPRQNTTEYRYDQANRLIEVVGTSTYTYDGTGLRASATVDGVTNNFVWDRASGLPLLLSDGDANYIYGPGAQVITRITSEDPVTLVGANATGGVTAPEMILSMPAGVAPGDLIVGSATYARGAVGVGRPAGYTDIGTFASEPESLSNPGSVLHVWARWATGNETSLTVRSDATQTISTAVAVYRGVDPTDPIEPLSWAGNERGATVTVPGVDAKLEDGRLLLIAGATNEPNSWNWRLSPSMTAAADHSGAMAAIVVGDEALTATGPTGSRSATYTSDSTSSQSAQPGAQATAAPSPTPHPQTIGVLLALKPVPDSLIYHHDQLGSVRAITDQAGDLRAAYTYAPYGNPTETWGTIAQPFGFAGEYTDAETGFQYLRNRYYDPATGQFLTRDPVEHVTREPYGYAGNNPVNFTDPLGLQHQVGDSPPTAGESLSRQNAGCDADASRSGHENSHAIANFVKGVASFVQKYGLACLGGASVTGRGGATAGTFTGHPAGSIIGGLIGGIGGCVIAVDMQILILEHDPEKDGTTTTGTTIPQA